MPEDFKFPDETTSQSTSSEQKLDVRVEDDEAPLNIEVVDDTPEEDRGREPVHAEEVTDDELREYSEKVQKRIKTIDASRHTERRAREAAERERAEIERLARNALNEVERMKGVLAAGEKVHRSTLESAATSKLEIAKKKLAEAHDAYDTVAIVAAQQELAEATWEVQNAKKFAIPPLQTENPGVQSEHVQADTRPRVDEKTARWTEKNPWFGVNRKLTAYALAAHQELVDSGVAPSSDAYFQRIDADMRRTFPDAFKEVHPRTERTSRPGSVVAPATRSTSPVQITLTKTQAAIAKKMGLSLEAYAKEVKKLEAQNAQ